MAITHVDIQTGSVDNDDFITINKPTGTVENDVLIFWVSVDSGDTHNVPTGFTAGNNLVAGSSDHRLSWAYKVAGASEPTTYTYDGWNNEDGVGAISAYRGVDTTSPINIDDIAKGDSAAPIAPTITTDADGCMIVAIAACEDGGASPFTPPSGYTERADLNINTGPGAAAGSSADIIQSSLGATGTATFTASETDTWCAAHIALTPATGTGVDVAVPLKTFSLAGQIPIVGSGASVASPVKNYSLAEQIPSVGTGVKIDSLVKPFTRTNFIPSIQTGVTVSVPLGSFTLTGFIPDVASGVNVAVPLKAYTFTGFIPTVAIIVAGVDVSVPLGAFSLISFIPNVLTGVNIIVPFKSFSLIKFIPSINIGVNVIVPNRTFNLSFNIPIVGTSVNVQAPSNSYILSANVPGIASGVSINVPVKGFTKSGFVPVITAATIGAAEVLVPLGTFNLVGFVPGISIFFAPLVINVPLKQFNLEGQIPEVYSVSSLERIASHIDLTPPFDINQRLYLIKNFGLVGSILKDGFTGQFTTTDGKTVLVRNGIVTDMY